MPEGAILFPRPLGIRGNVGFDQIWLRRHLDETQHRRLSITNPGQYRMTMGEPKTYNDWLQLERDVGRLFSAAPLSAVGSLGQGPREELYLGRAAEVRLMVHAVQDPAKHILLYGERGLGKTSLANTFWRHRSTSSYPILAARVQVYPFDDFSSLWIRALEEFQTVFRHHGAEIRANFPYVTPDIVRHEFQKLPRHLGAIMIVDEFDLLRDREACELTANLLKSLHDHAINVTVLLIGVAENVEELIINHQSLRRVLTLVKLDRMSVTDLKAILDSRLRLTPLVISDEARSEIVTLSCGLPYYVQTLGKFVAQNAIKNQRLQIEVEDVTAAIDNFLLEGGQSFADDYQRATDSRLGSNIFREVILASALAHSDPSGVFGAFEVSKTLNVIAPGKNYYHTRVQQYLAQFSSDRRGKILLRSGMKSDYRYRFSDALMQPFIIMKAIKDDLIDEKLRHLLFRWLGEEDHEKEYQPGIATADARQHGIVPSLTAEAGGENAVVSESRQLRSKLGIQPANAGLSAAVPQSRHTPTLAPRGPERSWRLFRR